MSQSIDLASPSAHMTSAQVAAWAGLALFCTAFAVLEVVNHGTPTLVAAVLALGAPDVTMLIGAGEAGQGMLSRRAVPFYNLAHRPWLPLVLLVGYTVAPLDWPPLFTAGLAWLAHIAADRALGYGLRDRDGSRRG